MRGTVALAFWLMVALLSYCRPAVDVPPRPHELAPALVLKGER